MIRSLRKLLLAVPLLVAVLAVQGQSAPLPKAAGTKAKRVVRAAAALAGAAADRSAVLASFDGGRITVRDLEAAMANKAPVLRKEIATPAGRENFLRDIERYDLLALEAARRGYAEHLRVLDAATTAAIDEMIRVDLAVDPASIAAEDVARYFETWRNSRERPAVRRASHIQVATETEARALVAELSGADEARFARVAGARSTDPRTRDQGGGLGYLTRDGRTAEGRPVPGLPPAVVAAVFSATREGAVVPEPVRYAGGFSVVMFHGELPAVVKRLADVEGELREEIAAARKTQALDALVAKLRAELKPVIHSELLDQIKLDMKAPDIPSGFPAAPPDPRAPTVMVPPDSM